MITTDADQARLADIVIIGAGSAGCVLANRLSADPARRVVLIEAGGGDDDPAIANPQLWPLLMGGPHDWGYATTPQAGLGGRVLGYPRGKVLGGSSAINALGHQRGDGRIFDQWARMGCAGWSAADLAPYFRRSETFDGGADAWRGGDGPLDVVRPAPGRRSPLAEAFLEAAIAAGHAACRDFNADDMLGASWNQLAMRGGERHSEAVAYLRPVADRPNLTILLGAQVMALEFDGRRCTGLTALTAGGARTIAGGEVILCAGAVDSPRLLMLSGIGDPEALSRVGVGVRAALPEVGRNLHDHPLCGLVHAPRAPLPASVYNHGEAVVFARSTGTEEAADIQIMCVDVPFATPETGPGPEGGFSLVACLMTPISRGTIALASNDPKAPALIDPNFLGETSDLQRFSAGLRMARAIGQAAPLARFSAGEALPGPDKTSDADLFDFLRRGTGPFYHPAGTCRMGGDQDSVVDAELRVRQIDGLRVVDASVMPILPNAMPNAAVVAMAEKAADLILGRA